MANEIVKLLVDPADSPDVGFEYDAFGGGNTWGYAYLGKDQPTWDDSDAAMRFRSVAIPQGSTVNLAQLRYDYDTVGATSGRWRFRVYGIDEDNTADFTSGNPFGRSRTDAYVEINDDGPPTSGGSKTIDVSSIVNEIVGRGGWSSGNAIGFVLIEFGSDSNVWARLDNYNSYFAFRLAAEPNFTPTPKSVAAPTFPAVDSYGMKISYPGYEVLDATEEQLYFTTRKREYKIIAQGKINTTAGVVYNIAHGLSYKPCARAFFKSISSTKRYKIPRFIPGEIQDPDADTTNGQIEVDATNVKIMTTDACEVYYYIYIDELAT